MNLITREELKAKLDGKGHAKLVFVLSDWAYQQMHIPGSLHFASPLEACAALGPREEIVVYDSNEFCPASRIASQLLERRGYRNVRRYAGGLIDWEAAGYPLEGKMVQARLGERKSANDG